VLDTTMPLVALHVPLIQMALVETQHFLVF
jgi:hypothetical protein